MPPDSALHRDGAMWTQDNEIAAAGIEVTQVWLSMLLGAWVKQGTKLPPVFPITHPHRPVAEKQTSATSDPAQIARILGGR